MFRFSMLVRNPRLSFGGWRFAMVFCVAIIGFAMLFCLSAEPALAQGFAGAQDQADAVANAAGIDQGGASLPEIIGRIIYVLLSFVGILLLLILLYAGFLWMTAGGDASKIERAKQWIKNAIIGLIIIVSAFGITNFILGMIVGNITGGGGVNAPGSGLGSFSSSAGSLGGGIIESHYPRRNAMDVPRNAAIIVTFKQPIQINSIVQDYNDGGTPADLTDDIATEGLNDTAVQIYRTSEGAENRLASNEVRVRFTEDRRTFVFRPVDYLGSATEDVGYTVALMPGLEGVILEGGSPAFSGSFGEGYEWTFETGTVIDTEPPRIRSVFPQTGTRVDRNAVIQITFNEAIDPTASTGLVSAGFENIGVFAGGFGGVAVDGRYTLSNEYRTVEFLPSEVCGLNTCGEEIYCLPEGASQADVVVHAATLDGDGPMAQFLAAGFDGIVDIAGNSLDGNANMVAEGRGADDYSWGFGVTNNINLTAPIIEATMPGADLSDPTRSNVDPYEPIRIRFDSLLQSSSFNTDQVQLQASEPLEYADTFWWSTGLDGLTDENVEPETLDDIITKHEGYIRHRIFATSTLYAPYIYSGVRNVYQNCFNPASSVQCLGAPNCCWNNPSANACDFGS